MIRMKTFPSSLESLRLSFYTHTYFRLTTFLTLSNNYLFSISIILSSRECSIKRIIEYETFWHWRFSLSLFIWDSFRLLNVSIVCCFLFPSSIPRYGYTTIYLHLEGHLGYFQFSTIVNKLL